MRQNAFSGRPTINASRHLFHFDGVTESVTKVFSRAAQLRPLRCCPLLGLWFLRLYLKKSSENSKANRIETMKGPAESGQICSVGRRKIAKKIAKNKRCYANTLRPRSRMLLKVMKGG
jgi:hypothetical protein